MADIFISYKREEQPIAKKLADALQKKGWTVWWDPEIRAGERFDDVIEKALIESKCVVVLWSKLSVESQNVKDEATYALNRDKLVPILIEEVNLPYWAERINTGQLINWDSSDNFPGYHKLVSDISKIIAEEDKRRRKEAERKVEKERRRTQEEERKLREAEQKKPEEERQRLEEEKQLLAEEKRKFEEEQKRIEAARKAEEERKQEETEAKRKSQPEKSISNKFGMEFVLITAGKFVMGSPTEEPGRKKIEKQHEVIISKPFYLQTTPVSQGQWKKAMGSNPSIFKHIDAPVEYVSWNDAQKFIEKLNQMEGTNKYRLPTEAEWEYACRAETETAYSFDNVDKLDEYAWHRDNSESQTHPVGKKKPNAWGLYDMHGNVWEWCQDRYGDYPSNSVADPKGPDKGERRVLRGGSWAYKARFLRSAYRFKLIPDDRSSNLGFRVARDF